MPGAKALIRALPDDGWAVVTSAGRELARRRLSWAGLRTPRSLVTADEVRKGKPSPEGYLLAAAELGVDASNCVVIEDSPAGIEAARAAGTSVVALTTTQDMDALPSVEFLLPDLVGIEVRAGRGGLVLTMGG